MRAIMPALLAVVIAALPSEAFAQFKPPTRPAPPPGAEKHLALVKEGVALHRKGDYDGALARYQAVLAENPDDLLAIYETSLTLAAKKDFAGALEAALRGADYQSERIGEFYNMIGNVYVLRKESEMAIRAFEYGIDLDPAEAQLYFNVAVSYAQARRTADAIRTLKTAVVLRPDYTSAHHNLAVVFLADGYPVPALMAAGRYLTLDVQTQRAASTLSLVNTIMRDSQQQSRGGGPSSPVPSGKLDEGDFVRVEEIIYAGRPRRTYEQVQATPEIGLLVEQMTAIGREFGRQLAAGPSASFAYQYYAPYFAEMSERNLVEPFVYYIFQRTNLPGVADWVKANPDRIKEFLEWSSRFEWAKPAIVRPQRPPAGPPRPV